MLVQYITAAFGSVCDLKWARKHRDLFYPQTHCMSLRWASRGEGLCRQVQLHTHWTSVHNLPNGYDEVCAKDIIFSASFSFIIPSSSCQISATVCFRQTWTFCSVVTSLMRLCSSLCFFAEILLDDFMLTHPIFLASDKFQQVLLQQYPFFSPEP